MINIPLYLDYLITHKLTQQQYIFLHLIYLKDTNLIRKYKAAFPTEDGSLIGGTPLNYLIERGFVVWDGKDKKMRNYTLTDKFLDIFVDKYFAGNEIWDLYPAIINSGGKNLPLILMDKNEFRDLYFNAIGGLRSEHEQVKKDLTYGVEQGLIKGKIDMFVKSEFWRNLRAIRLNQVKPVSNSLQNDNELG